MRILALDTSGPYCAVALLSGGACLESLAEDMPRGQAERLLPLAQEVLARHDMVMRDLDAVAVGIGPGNFTGIRISVAAARGLALALEIPAVGVSTLDAMALDAGFVVTAIRAPADMLYSQCPGGATVLSALEDMPLPPARAEACVIGYRADEIAARTGGCPAAPRYPLAEAIARKAKRRRHNDHLVAPAPLYIRAADAAPMREAPPVILDA